MKTSQTTNVLLNKKFFVPTQATATARQTANVNSDSKTRTQDRSKMQRHTLWSGTNIVFHQKQQHDGHALLQHMQLASGTCAVAAAASAHISFHCNAPLRLICVIWWWSHHSSPMEQRAECVGSCIALPWNRPLSPPPSTWLHDTQRRP